ncbi:MAG: hypothetical protein U5N58_05065 [Actinomycetota bacterium]|nr:hypothetical protein [Actinomycetota bacterium]
MVVKVKLGAVEEEPMVTEEPMEGRTYDRRTMDTNCREQTRLKSFSR